MKPALAKARDSNPLEDLGRATLQIVHDLKNQLNGLKLYATFLRKRLERDDRAPEERETLAKLIAGLDRAARDMTALVRYSRPLDLQRRPHTDLRKTIPGAAQVGASRQSGDSTRADLTCEIEGGPFYGEFDPTALAEAFDAITEEAISGVPQRDANQISLHVSRTSLANSPQVLLEWRGVKPGNRSHSFAAFHDHATVYMALAAKIIEVHEGRIEYDATAIRVSLPLSE